MNKALANMPTAIQIDGSQGEGGGQILRTALALSMITVFGLSWLTWNGMVGQDLWFQVVTAIGGAYNIFNSIEKVGK